MSDELTLEEQEKILIVAESLIAEPESWTKGRWKCPAVKPNERGNPEWAKDANGNPLYNYCIEGAVNEAALRVLGPERAYSELDLRKEDSRRPTSRLGLNRVSQQLHGIYAMEYNDGSGTHEGVLQILRTRLGQVRDLIKGGGKA